MIYLSFALLNMFFGSSFHNKQPAVYTLPNYIPPTTISDAVVKNSIIGDGCLLNVGD